VGEDDEEGCYASEALDVVSGLLRKGRIWRELR
jgi:hypothetical protein